MAHRSKHIENLSDEELNELLDKGDALELAEGSSYSREEVEFLFQYLHALIMINSPERASEVFDALKPAIDAQVADEAQREEGLENLLEWALEAIRMIPETRNSFVCMPIYLELFDAFAGAEGRMAVRLTRARIQLLHHIEFWVSKGGVMTDLPEEDQELIGQIGETIQQEVGEQLLNCKAQGWYTEMLQLHRAMARFHLSSSEPNEAIAQLKSAAEITPQVPDALPTDQGDQYLEIGKIFFSFKKYPTARKYFVMAQECFEALGEEYDNFYLKAEAWVEECDKVR